MILVKNIDIITVDSNIYELRTEINAVLQSPVPIDDLIKQHFIEIEEIIEGVEFINVRGESVWIGLSNDAQEAVGLPMKAFHNMSEMIDNQNYQIKKLKRRVKQREELHKKYVRKMINMSFWKRLKYLFMPNKAAWIHAQ